MVDLTSQNRTKPGFFSRLFGTGPDPREELRPLWHRVVALSREPFLYADLGVADTVNGRFDMITATLAVVVARMERNADLIPESALLTELFVEDMDGQLREMGIGDVVVGKHIGRMMQLAGGRLGAYRDHLVQGNDTAMAEAVRRNVEWSEGGKPEALAKRLVALFRELEDRSRDTILAGDFTW